MSDMDKVFGMTQFWPRVSQRLLTRFDEFFSGPFCMKLFVFSSYDRSYLFLFCPFYLLKSQNSLGKKILKSRKQSPHKSRPNVLSPGLIFRPTAKTAINKICIQGVLAAHGFVTRGFTSHGFY